MEFWNIKRNQIRSLSLAELTALSPDIKTLALAVDRRELSEADRDTFLRVARAFHDFPHVTDGEIRAWADVETALALVLEHEKQALVRMPQSSAH